MRLPRKLSLGSMVLSAMLAAAVAARAAAAQVPLPTIAAPTDIVITRCSGVDIGRATAVDAQGNDLLAIDNDAPAKFPPGVTLVTWTATDREGNRATARQRVTFMLGDDRACCPAGTTVIEGTPNDDELNGTNGSDCILGHGGRDVINGFGGKDYISGGRGDDDIDAGPDDDLVFAGVGDDAVFGNLGNDALYGGDGDDILLGGFGDDMLGGGRGRDVLRGQSGRDVLDGDAGPDELRGGSGDDTLVGGANEDSCRGGFGDDTFAQCDYDAPDSCLNGARDGTETDVDCGGACVACSAGYGCVTSNDCRSEICSSGVCQAPPGPRLAANVNVTSDWGNGYCAVLQATNEAARPTSSYTVNLHTNASSIYTSWNGTLTGYRGPVSVTSCCEWNGALSPGESDASIGFCANRDVPGNGAVPEVLGATATFL